MGIVIGAVAVVFVLALIIFPGVRGKLKVLVGGFLNIFVEDIAKTPEGAKAVFQQAIEEVQERYNKAGDTLNRFVGEQSSVQKNLCQQQRFDYRRAECCGLYHQPYRVPVW